MSRVFCPTEDTSTFYHIRSVPVRSSRVFQLPVSVAAWRETRKSGSAGLTAVIIGGGVTSPTESVSARFALCRFVLSY